MKPHNFSAGPSILPQVVFEQASAAVQNFADTGLSVLEVSHRSKEFSAVMENAVSLVKELLSLPDNYHVMFLSGGASTQFFMTAMNFMDKDSKFYYLDTGTWSKKAIKEAKEFGQLEVLGSSADKNYKYIPKPSSYPTDGRYLHMTSNNTIFGTQYQEWPETTMPLVCDASSDIFSRSMPISKFGCIYAGAQKNMGPAGTTLVIVREDMLDRVTHSIPTMLNYRTHIDKNSMFNTPPVFPVYVSMLTMQWIKQQGGITAVQAKNKEKAKLLYDAIDSSSMFSGTTAIEDRSLMNVTFVANNEAHTADFLKLCADENISGISGHRQVGGFRASIYNAMPLSSVEHLVDVMKRFEQKA